MSTTTSASATSWVEEGSARFVELVPQHVERLRWDARRLRAHQDEALADLVRTAATESPFHRRRLAGLDLDTVCVDRLRELPVMSKAEMMAHLDDVFTDRRLSRGLIDRHLAVIGSEPELLLDEYVVLASGGSSGTRGVFVMPRDRAVSFTVTVLRAGMARLAATSGWPPPAKVPVGIVMAPSPIHATRAMPGLLSSVAAVTYAPVTLPLAEIVDRLNRAQPVVLVGYPTVLARLADAVEAGELRIRPEMVLTSAEQLLPEHAERITVGFGTPPINSFASTEGLVGSALPGGNEFTFASDQAIVEFVDADDEPVPVGSRADHVLITNLASSAQPLLRYRMDDAMTQLPPADDHGHQRATVDGRNDDLLTLGDATVHPLAIRSVLLRHQAITEYQVTVDSSARPTVALALVTSGPVSLVDVRRDVAAALDAAGATADVSAIAVSDLPRHPETGKVTRFVDIGARATAPPGGGQPAADQ